MLLLGVAVFFIGCDQSRTLPASTYGKQHVEFVKFLEIFTVAELDCKNEGEMHCVPSMRVGAEPWTKIKWKTAYAEDYSFGLDAMRKSGYGRLGEVYLSVEGKPTNLALDTVLKPQPWELFLKGPTTKMVYHVFLWTSYYIEDYVDLGEYLIKKGLAHRMELLPPDTLGGACSTEWYEVKLAGRNPVWMGIMNDGGNAVGTLQVRLDYERPVENEQWCGRMEEMLEI